MQEFQSIPGLAGRLFGVTAAADLRRAQAQQGPASRCGGIRSPEAVKCPRCESTNTKFCYYNNYNLSQPRHFCKSCRRYWTKGGVLRNVPVGGGCRKSKRSSSSSSASSAPSTPTVTDNAKNQRRASASSPRSSSGGSGNTSPTAAAAAAANVATTPTTPATPPSNTIPVINHHATNPFPTDVPPPAPIFADQAAALASLFTPPPPPPLPVFSFTAQPNTEEGIASVLLAGQTEPVAPTTAADMTPFTSLDTRIFELGDVPPPAYWSAGSCWTDVPDPTVYLP